MYDFNFSSLSAVSSGSTNAISAIILETSVPIIAV